MNNLPAGIIIGDFVGKVLTDQQRSKLADWLSTLHPMVGIEYTFLLDGMRFLFVPTPPHFTMILTGQSAHEWLRRMNL